MKLNGETSISAIASASNNASVLDLINNGSSSFSNMVEASRQNGPVTPDGAPPRPVALVPIFENIPEALTTLPHWVLWKYDFDTYKPRKDPLTGQWSRISIEEPRWSKVLYQVGGGRKARSDGPSTWSSFDDVVAAYRRYYYTRDQFDGIGFCMTVESGLVGFDFDHCLNDGVLSEAEARYLTMLDSYAELSPSGHGLRIFTRGVLPPEGRRLGNLEIYVSGRYLTVTGHRLDTAPHTINERHDAVAAVHADVFRDRFARRGKGAPQTGTVTIEMTDAEIEERLDKIRQSAKVGERFILLYDCGDFGNVIFQRADKSQSAADMELCSTLVWWFGLDPVLIDRIFRDSALMRNKWDEKRGAKTYGEMTVAKAIAESDGTYSQGYRPLYNLIGLEARPGAAVWILGTELDVDLASPKVSEAVLVASPGDYWSRNFTKALRGRSVTVFVGGDGGVAPELSVTIRDALLAQMNELPVLQQRQIHRALVLPDGVDSWRSYFGQLGKGV